MEAISENAGEPMYTYFVISPGFEEGCCVRYTNGSKGNYIKFGDENAIGGAAGLRAAYATHNPDIGVPAIMTSTVFANPNLGTQLKQYIVNKGYQLVGTTEWISVPTDPAWELFEEMRDQWDNKVLVVGDLANLRLAIDDCLP
jgi:hypothetical protein